MAESKLVVKLVLDTTEFDAALERVKAALTDLSTPRRTANVQAWRKAIADQVRRNCTPSSEAYTRGGDALIYAVCDWIENPPEWSLFEAPKDIS